MAKRMAEQGWDTILLERGSVPRHKVCGEFLSPEARRLFEEAGLDELLLSLQAETIGRWRIVHLSGKELSQPLDPPAYGISRYALDSALQQAAVRAGARLLTNVKASGIRRSGDGYLVQVRQDGRVRTLAARTVTAAWGRFPGALVPGSLHKSGTESWVGVKCHFARIDHRPEVELYFFPGGYLGVNPVGPNTVNVAALFTAKAFHEAGKSPREAIGYAVRMHPELQKRLAGGLILPGTEQAVAPVATDRPAQAWNVVPHIGDAAMVIPPLCGDGMAMAIRTAERCSHFADLYLRGTLTLAEWRREYERTLKSELNGPARTGRILQTVLSDPMLSFSALEAGRLFPFMTRMFVRATRLPLKKT
jgi:flavin-dependent dehydrogenase